jgi:very-short-patch-repair endonuclease
MTDAEERLWKTLRGHRFVGVQFRRQVPIGPYIVDFCCHAARLVIEVDGGQHGEEPGRRRDAQRDSFLAGEGYEVLRFWNSEVLAETDAVLDVIWSALADRRVVSVGADTPLPVPPPQGGRGRRQLSHPPSAEASPSGMSEEDRDACLPVPSPLVGEGQGGGCADVPQFSETTVSRPSSNATVSMTGDTNAGQTP